MGPPDRPETGLPMSSNSGLKVVKAYILRLNEDRSRGSAERLPSLPVQNFLMWHSDGFHGRVMRCSSPPLIFNLVSSPKETTMKEWLKPEITESEAGMEVTSYLPAELDRA
jgi:coenzyme PQQ precursor peptide PqqA